MISFPPHNRLVDPSFEKWLSGAVRRFWCSGFDRGASSRNLESIRHQLANRDVWCWGVENATELGIAILAPCAWETSVIGRPVGKVLFMAADSYPIALPLAEEIRNHAIAHRMALISADPGCSPAYVVCALENAGFHIASQYYLWEGKVREVVTVAERLAQVSTFRFATAADAQVLATIAEEAFVYGRYLADPYLPKEWGKQLYREWAANSCRGYADAVIVYESEHEVVGFVTGKLMAPGKTGWIDLLVVRGGERNRGVGIALLAKLFLWFAEQGVETIRIDPQKPNVEINRIYQHFGFKLEDSGLVLHWCPRFGSMVNA